MQIKHQVRCVAATAAGSMQLWTGCTAALLRYHGSCAVPAFTSATVRPLNASSDCLQWLLQTGLHGLPTAVTGQ